MLIEAQRDLVQLGLTVARQTLQITTSELLPPEALEICGTPERWLVHHHDKWMPLSASYIAFLMGLNQKSPSALGDAQD